MRISRFVTDKPEPDLQKQAENICGVLVHAVPEERMAVKAALEALPGVEVHAVSDGGKLVVTTEDTGDTWAGATIEGFNAIKGVLSVALAYHHFDSDLEGEIVP